MLRQTLTINSSSGVLFRRWLTTTSRKSGSKRGLTPDQLAPPVGAAGSGRTGSSPKLPASPPPPPPLKPNSAAAAQNNSNLLPLGAVGALAVGGAAYYYYNTLDDSKSSSSEAPIPVVKEETKVQKPKSRNEVPAKTEASSNGNRVLSIAVPAKMKNTADCTTLALPPTHPEDGNHVTLSWAHSHGSIPVVDQNDVSATKAAVEELQKSTTEQATAALVESHQTLWNAMDAAFFTDLDSLNNAQLKARVVQLASEMKDRTKWEAVRLKEFLAMKEKETVDKYLEILQKQRLEFEDIMSSRLREQKNELMTQMHNTLLEKEATIQSVLSTALAAQQEEHDEDKKAFEAIITSDIKTALEEEYATKLEEYKHQVAHDLQQKVTTLESLKEKLDHLETALEASLTSKEGSLKAHRLSAAALALAEKMETNTGAAMELAALKHAAGNEGVIATACANIPDAVETGVPTLPELQTRYEAAHQKCRQAALVPAGRPGLDGHLAGMLFASLKYAPDPNDPAPESDKDNAEYVLVRAHNYVQLGELERAVEQLEKLQGLPAFTIQDWMRDAINRIAVEKSLKVIKMECALLNESCLDE